MYKTNTHPMLLHINVGTGKDITIRKMAEIIKQVVGCEGKLFLIQPNLMASQEN